MVKRRVSRPGYPPLWWTALLIIHNIPLVIKFHLSGVTINDKLDNAIPLKLTHCVQKTTITLPDVNFASNFTLAATGMLLDVGDDAFNEFILFRLIYPLSFSTYILSLLEKKVKRVV